MIAAELTKSTATQFARSEIRCPAGRLYSGAGGFASRLKSFVGASLLIDLPHEDRFFTILVSGRPVTNAALAVIAEPYWYGSTLVEEVARVGGELPGGAGAAEADAADGGEVGPRWGERASWRRPCSLGSLSRRSRMARAERAGGARGAGGRARGVRRRGRGRCRHRGGAGERERVDARQLGARAESGDAGGGEAAVAQREREERRGRGAGQRERGEAGVGDADLAEAGVLELRCARVCHSGERAAGPSALRETSSASSAGLHATSRACGRHRR